MKIYQIYNEFIKEKIPPGQHIYKYSWFLFKQENPLLDLCLIIKYHRNHKILVHHFKGEYFMV